MLRWYGEDKLEHINTIEHQTYIIKTPYSAIQGMPHPIIQTDQPLTTFPESRAIELSITHGYFFIKQMLVFYISLFYFSVIFKQKVMF